MDETKLPQLRDTIVQAFGDPASYRDWVRVWLTKRIPDENVYNVMVDGFAFSVQVYQTLEWFKARSELENVLQELVLSFIHI